MANIVLNPSIIAKAAVRILDNELGMSSRVFRAEDEFNQSVNGFKVGASVNVRKPAQFTVRTGAVASAQDVTEGFTTLTVNQQIGVDFKFTSTELTLNIGELADRVIKPAMVQLANRIDTTVAGLYNQVPNWVGTPGSTISTFAGFMRGVQRMNEGAVPQDQRSGILSPADEASLAAAQSGMYIEKLAGDAYRTGAVGKIAQVDTYMSQNAPIHTTGSRTNGTVSGAGQAVAYSAVLNSAGVPGSQTLNVAGLGASGTAKAGDVFTIANVFAVNPVTKQTLSYLQQFAVTADATADGAGAAALTIAPAIITSGAFQSVSAAPANGAAVTWVGSASTNYQQNVFFHKNAFALAVVPMVKPMGAVKVARESYKGLSVRLIPYFDGTNDVDQYRLDVLFGVKALDPRLAVRVNG